MNNGGDMDYADFLASKGTHIESVGFVVDESDLNPMLFDWQRAITRWALAKGRAALFLDTGLGKTAIQLEWANRIVQRDGCRVLILAPLAVSYQTEREASKFKIETPVRVCKTGDDVGDGINITNYERLHYFDPADFNAIVLDESSILKGFGGKTRRAINEFAKDIEYRLACTATPAPNDLIEITNHAEYLDVMSGKEIIALFFRQDGNTTHAWRLKGHARGAFWKWMSEWSIAIRMPSDIGYSDDGFDLPPLRRHAHVVEGEATEGMLFPVEAKSLMERRGARRASMDRRVKMCAEIVAEHPDDTWLIWCDLNAESEALTRAIPDAVEVKGADKPEYKEEMMLGFAAGNVRVLVSKPSICGFGMNFQTCHRMAFVGLSDSFEMLYQATRRCWRFGQTEPVDVHVITANTEGAVVRNIERKETQAAEMFDMITKEMAIHELNKRTCKMEDAYHEDVASGDAWTLYLGDSCEVIKQIPDESVGLTVFSPPFPGMYAYTNSARDVGNVANIKELVDHFGFMVDELLRITKPGRSCCIHLTQEPVFKGEEGYSGMRDFRGEIIRLMQKHDWAYTSERTIDKDPQLKAARTKDHGLAMKTAAKDSAILTGTMADYLLQFKKKGENTEPIRALIDHPTDPDKRNPNGWITAEEWIQWASCCWYGHHRIGKGGIRESDVLSVRTGAREDDDEKHLCPLQLGVIERCIKLWSAPGDTVFSPFAGIGSEGFEALKWGRKFIGIELKGSYWRVACENLQHAEREYGGGKGPGQQAMFDNAGCGS
jgi:DNA modification methylase/superfamily II DNA or RNA helicase